jgi:hypothetical protein
MKSISDQQVELAVIGGGAAQINLSIEKSSSIYIFKGDIEK